ncbi:hypothetical protein VNO77_23480 [Canavalia gladiata]|uniref:Uncharacterized protein n=1 Tax=Canavalia gladiata TaxID=3824 RepID=A0AAN9L4J1_CANGL
MFALTSDATGSVSMPWSNVPHGLAYLKLHSPIDHGMIRLQQAQNGKMCLVGAGSDSEKRRLVPIDLASQALELTRKYLAIREIPYLEFAQCSMLSIRSCNETKDMSLASDVSEQLA